MISEELKKRIGSVLEKHQGETTEDIINSPQVKQIYESLDGCDSMTDIKLDTAVLNNFSSFEKFIFDRCRNNPSTFGGKTHVNLQRGIEYIKEGAHVDSDDQGFEGGWIHDKDDNIIFSRFIQDDVDAKDSEVVEN